MLYLVSWYRGCAAAPKPAEVGSSPTGITLWLKFLSKTPFGGGNHLILINKN